ncbi:MAG: hypothetical protein PVTTEEND_000774 [Candidatus Fervidibacter sp.]|jgi:hypothetical protein
MLRHSTFSGSHLSATGKAESAVKRKGALRQKSAVTGFNSDGGDGNDATVGAHRVAHVGVTSELAEGAGDAVNAAAGKGRHRQRTQLNGLTGRRAVARCEQPANPLDFRPSVRGHRPKAPPMALDAGLSRQPAPSRRRGIQPCRQRVQPAAAHLRLDTRDGDDAPHLVGHFQRPHRFAQRDADVLPDHRQDASGHSLSALPLRRLLRMGRRLQFPFRALLAIASPLELVGDE